MTYRNLPNTLYTEIHPTPVEKPELVIYNHDLARELGLQDTWQDPLLLAGNQVPDEMTPIAQAYLGHQFGHLARLGDGRAILLDEVVSPSGERYDIQLKGSGPTPYSRRGDGRAALGPMLREYLVSEAMHALGIPTSRSLAVVTTGEDIYRQTILPGAILTRVAKSHIRVGTFQYAFNEGVIKDLADYTIERHYPSCATEAEPYLCLLQEVVTSQAKLIAQWMSVGFIHGVMNTDNMALSGETIDYGPCAFMDHYQANQVFSSIDQQGRYRYSQQPAIAKWNLARLAETLLELVDEDQQTAIDKVVQVLNTFEDTYQTEWLSLMSQKLGIAQPEEGDATIIEELLQLLERVGLDFTNSFVRLTDDPTTPLADNDLAKAWHNKWLAKQPDTDLMKQVNPRVIPRNRQLQEALDAAEDGDLSLFRDMLEVVQNPYRSDVPAKYTVIDESKQQFVTFCGT